MGVGIHRLGRNAAEVIVTIRELRDRGIVLRSLREGIDTSNASGRMLADTDLFNPTIAASTEKAMKFPRPGRGDHCYGIGAEGGVGEGLVAGAYAAFRLSPRSLPPRYFRRLRWRCSSATQARTGRPSTP